MDLSTEFEKAVKQLCYELNEDYKNVEISEDNNSYSARSNKFEFYLNKEQSSFKIGIYIYYNDRGDYFPYEEIEIDTSIPLERYSSYAVYNFNTEHNKVNLKSIFGDREIRVYGSVGYISNYEGSIFTHLEASITLEGIRHINSIIDLFKNKRINNYYINTIKAIRFRHIRKGDLYRTYTYAFYIPLGIGYWVIFPILGGPDSGGAGIAFQRIERLLDDIRNSGIDIQMEYYDINGEELCKYLYENGDSFDKTYHWWNNDVVFECMYKPYELQFYVFGDRFDEEFNKFKTHCKNNELGTALRDLRALVNEALKMIFETKNIQLPEKIRDRSIEKLAGELEGKDIINHKLRSLFSAFASISNEPSHSIKHEHRKLVLLTIMIGMQLLLELAKIMNNGSNIQI